MIPLLFIVKPFHFQVELWKQLTTKQVWLALIQKSLETAKLQGYLQGSVGPRPIYFESTVDEK
jgi:hypothetical protein